MNFAKLNNSQRGRLPGTLEGAEAITARGMPRQTGATRNFIYPKDKLLICK